MHVSGVDPFFKQTKIFRLFVSPSQQTDALRQALDGLVQLRNYADVESATRDLVESTKVRSPLILLL